MRRRRKERRQRRAHRPHGSSYVFEACAAGATPLSHQLAAFKFRDERVPKDCPVVESGVVRTAGRAWRARRASASSSPHRPCPSRAPPRPQPMVATRWRPRPGRRLRTAQLGSSGSCAPPPSASPLLAAALLPLLPLAVRLGRACWRRWSPRSRRAGRRCCGPSSGTPRPPQPRYRHSTIHSATSAFRFAVQTSFRTEAAELRG